MEPLLQLLQPEVLLPWLAGMIFGTFVGATPGLTATMAVALLVPFTFYLPNPNTGLALIIGVSFSAIFSGDIPAVFLRIPGTPASAAGALDGHALARRGQGHFALGLDLACSAIGGTVGVLLLMVLAPQLAKIALQFSSYEYFWMGVAGLAISAVITQSPLPRGCLAAALGVLISTVGIDRVTGTVRLTFGSPELTSGIDFIAVMIGLFGLSEVLRNTRAPGAGPPEVEVPQQPLRISALIPPILRHKLIILRSSLLGTVVGALPGAGADVAAWAAYALEQRISKKPRDFGTGCLAGVIAPTSANNAAVAGAWIPALVLGIPGDSVTAIALGALVMYNIKTGPMVFEQGGDQIQMIFYIALITQVLLLPAGWFAIRTFGTLMKLPRPILYSGVIIFSVVGAYSLRNDWLDVWIMVAAGVLGTVLEKLRVPLPPLILGLILGPMVEEHFRVGLIKSSGSFTPFFTRPMSLAILTLLLLSLTLPWLARRSIANTSSHARD